MNTIGNVFDGFASFFRKRKQEAIFSDSDVSHFNKEHLSLNVPLGFDEAYKLGQYLLYACRNRRDTKASHRSVGFLMGLHAQKTYAWMRNGGETGHVLPKNSAEQIAGVCAAVFQEDIAKSKFGFLNPNMPYVMDNCGMGGDLILTANVSTIAAFIAAAAGAPMCKHGSPGNATACGSSDFVSSLAINMRASRRKVEECVVSEGFGYTEALDVRYKQIHKQTHKIAGVPHMNDIIGPITNPLSPQILTRRILGLNHVIPPRIVAEAYQILNERGITNLQHGIFVRGFTNKDCDISMDEVSICEGGTQVVELRNGTIQEYWLYASNFGIAPIPVSAISPPSGMSKKDFSLALLRGEIDGPPIQMVFANAALLFYLAGYSQDIKDCYKMAKEIHRGGKAYAKMLKVRKMLPAG